MSKTMTLEDESCTLGAELAAARAARWFAEKGIEWQGEVLGQLSARAQSILSLSLTVPPLLLGGGTLAILDEGSLATVPARTTIALISVAILITAFYAFVQALAVLYPKGRLAWPTPRGFYSAVVATLDHRGPEVSVDLTVAEILRRRILENNEHIAILKSLQCKATYNLGMSVVFGLAYLAFIAFTLLLQR